MSNDQLFKRQQAANLLIWQSALRIAGLMNLGTISADYVREAQVDDPPEKWVNSYVDTLSECAEKSWQDFRNNWQILLLTQDEALMWVAKIERAWANAG